MKLQITGDDELIGRLEALDKAGTRITRRALNLAVTPVIEDAKRRVMPVSKTIADSIVFTQRIYNKGQRHYVRIGPMKEDDARTVKAKFNPITGRVKARWHNPAKTSHLVEQGTQPHAIRVFGAITIQHPGARAYPFLVPAMDAKGGEAQDIFFAEAWTGIQNEMKKRARRAKRIQKKIDKRLAMGAPE